MGSAGKIHVEKSSGCVMCDIGICPHKDRPITRALAFGLGLAAGLIIIPLAIVEAINWATDPL